MRFDYYLNNSIFINFLLEKKIKNKYLRKTKISKKIKFHSSSCSAAH